MVLGALLVAGACASAPKERPRAPPPDPGELLLLDLESKLLRAKAVHLRARLVATGAVTADLEAELWLKEGNRARLEVKGRFEGREQRATFVSDGAQMKVGAKAAEPAAPELREALVYGLTRMGLLHNVALLVGGEAPDHGTGGAHSWVKAERARSLAPATKIAFDIVVATKVAGEGVLQLDGAGRLLERTQEVRFDVGAMKVTERYPLFLVDADLDHELDDALFAMPSP